MYQAEGPDIYGQMHPIETPELLKSRLRDFDRAVEKQATQAKASLLKAQRRCPELLTNEFKLMFLRAECLTVDLAVKRYLKYWTKRIDVFGDEKAFMPLTLGKGLVDDHVAIEVGYFRIIPGATDDRGRAVIFSDASRQDRNKYSRESMIRAVWYLLHAVLFSSESAQRHGVICVSDPSRAQFSQIDTKLAKLLIPSVLGAIPLRISAYHICNAPSYASMVWAVVKHFISARLRKRVFYHAGPKILKQLAAYGLESNMVPTCLGGTAEINHSEWMLDQMANGL